MPILKWKCDDCEEVFNGYNSKIIQNEKNKTICFACKVKRKKKITEVPYVETGMTCRLCKMPILEGQYSVGYQGSRYHEIEYGDCIGFKKAFGKRFQNYS